MKIHCIALTKNEEDIVGYCLTEAAKWADYIYVYDGASSDATWEIVKSLASRVIIPWKQDGKVFAEGLRAEVFNEFRHLSTEGDWWLQLNVDEFHLPNLRKRLAAIPASTNFVWGIPIEYYITWEDIANIDFTRPIEQVLAALRHYKIFWSEPRCFRYRKRLVWNSAWAWPRHVGLSARERILFKHYPYRSPNQVQKRLDTRRENRQRGFVGWEHASQAFWREKIVDAESCQVDDGSGRYAFKDATLPRHMESPGRRTVKAVMHASGLWP
jgi:glycosyltransferase involved in cell wall biosynthesis